MCLLVSCGVLKSYQKEYYLVMAYYKPARIPRVPTYHLRKPKIFISFNYTYDHGYRYLMSAWNTNPFLILLMMIVRHVRFKRTVSLE